MGRPANLTPLTELQRELVRSNVGLAFSAAARECRAGTDAERWLGYDEAVSVAMLSLTRAARSYDPNRATPAGFATYVFKALGRAIRDAANRARPPVQSTPYFEDLLADPWREDPALLAERADESTRLLGLVRRHLSGTERAAVEQAVMQGRDDADVARECGLTRQAVSFARKRAIHKLRELVGV